MESRTRDHANEHGKRLFSGVVRVIACSRFPVFEVKKDSGSEPIMPMLWEGGGRQYPRVPAFPSYLTGSDGQGVIDDFLWKTIGGCDIFVGLGWHRMGSKTGNYRSGTESEFKKAWERRSAGGKPRVILYYRKTAPIPADALGSEQQLAAEQYFGELEKLGLLGRFEEVSDLQRLLRADLVESISVIRGVDPMWSTLLARMKPALDS